jgi:hypothetical protein
LSYTEFTADVGYAAGGTQVVSSGAVVYAALPTLIEFYAPGWTVTAISVQHRLSLFDDTTDLGWLARWQSVNTLPFVYLPKRLTPTAASHTYLIKATGDSGSSINAGVGGAGVRMPGFLRISQRGG